MEGYGPATYGDRIAETYDALYEGTLDTEGAVETLADLAAGGPVLELAIGTGRLALPLVREAWRYTASMPPSEWSRSCARSQAASAIPVTMGDFADVGVEGEYRLIFIAFNTLFALLTQDDQLRCFANAAEHLTDDGLFVVEAFRPDLGRFDRGQRTNVSGVDAGQVMLDASRHDPLEQRVDSQHIVITEAGTKLYPVSIRYAFPSELDLMARLAGLELRERWGSWKRGALHGRQQPPRLGVRAMRETVRVACVQVEPVILDRAATLDKIAAITAEAKGQGAQLVVFPETFIPAYPSSAWATLPRRLGRPARQGRLRHALARVARDPRR